MKKNQKKQNLITILICMVIIVISLVGCAPRTKESYLEKYAEIYDNFYKSHDTFTKEDWNKTEEKINLYSGEYYNKFENELSTKEKMKIYSYKAKFNFYKELNNAKIVCDSLKNEWNIDETLNTLEEDFVAVQEYIENDFVNDLEEVGKESEKFINEMISDIEDALNDME